MPLTGRKQITPSTNADPRKSEQIKNHDVMFKRVDVFATKGSEVNAGRVWVGYRDASALSGSEAGSPLDSGDSYVFENVNLQWLYVAGQNDGDAILFNATD